MSRMTLTQGIERGGPQGGVARGGQGGRRDRPLRAGPTRTTDPARVTGGHDEVGGGGAVLRFLTAGESHGRALVVIVEGLPAGLPVGRRHRRRAGPAAPRLRARAADALRGRRDHAVGGRPPRAHPRIPVAIEIANTEWPKWTEEMSPEPGRTDRRPHPAPPGPRRPGRDAEVRLRRRPRRARAGVGPRDRGPGGRRRLGRSCSCAARQSIVSHVVYRDGRHRAGDSAAPRATSRRSTPPRCAASTRRRGRDDRRDQGGGKGRRFARRGRRSLAYGVPVGLGATSTGTASSTVFLAQALMSNPGGQGGRARRWLRGRGPAWLGGPRRDRLGRRRSHGYRAADAPGRGGRGRISNGGLVVARVAMKPLATLNRPVLETVDVATKEPTSPSRSGPTSPRCRRWASSPRR